ncbi:MAG TPA: response regulator [Pirellulales bacterium]
MIHAPQTLPDLIPEERVEQPLVLIVEDDADIGEFLADRLQDQGYRTQLTTNAETGMRLARLERPHLILMDVRLPGVDGMTACSQLTDDPATFDVPVILLSGLAQPDVVRKSRSVGARYFLRKPYDPDVLLVLIQQALVQATSS